MAKSGDIVIYEDSLTLKSEFGIIIIYFLVSFN